MLMHEVCRLEAYEILEREIRCRNVLHSANIIRYEVEHHEIILHSSESLLIQVMLKKLPKSSNLVGVSSMDGYKLELPKKRKKLD